MAASEPTPSTGSASEWRLDSLMADHLHETLHVGHPLHMYWHHHGCRIDLTDAVNHPPSACLTFDADRVRIIYDTGTYSYPCGKHGRDKGHLCQEVTSIDYADPEFSERLRDVLFRWLRECLENKNYDIFLHPWEVIRVADARGPYNNPIAGRRPGRVRADAAPDAQIPKGTVLD